MVQRAEVIAALSLALDLGTAEPLESALRTCIVALRLGERLGLSQADMHATYYVALLRHLGCTAQAPLAAEVFGDEMAAQSALNPYYLESRPDFFWELLRSIGRRRPPLGRATEVARVISGLPRLQGGAAASCEVAEMLALRLGFDPPIAAILRHAYERWDGKGEPGLVSGEAVALPMRIVQVAQDGCAFFRMGGVEAAIAMARRRTGHGLDPRIAELFGSEATHILEDLNDLPLWETVVALEPHVDRASSKLDLESAVHAMAGFVDLKSPYLVGHSSGVAAVAARAAERLGMPPDDVERLRHAALLHDLGRVGVSSTVWAAPRALGVSEWEAVRMHTYYGERILSCAPALARLGNLVGLHHERLDGSGYHRAAVASHMPLAARVLAAADVFQALREPRPHRAAHTVEAAADVLRREVQAGRLDVDAANAILEDAGAPLVRLRRTWPCGLSDREVEVLQLLARGCSNKQIAARLIISPKTAGHHVQHIYDKLGVSTRAAATLFAMQHDLLDRGASEVGSE